MNKNITCEIAALAAILFVAGCSSVPSPAVRFSFNETNPMEWRNSGVLSRGERPFRIGETSGLGVASAKGIDGLSFDGRRFISKQPANVPVWGTDRAGLPDTEIEKLFEGVQSFTVAAWIKTDSSQPQGRLLKTPAFQINYRGDRLETGFSKPRKWYASDISSARFDSVGQWRFVAIVWQAGGAVRYYSATKTAPVVAAGSSQTDGPMLSGNETGCWLTVGNSEADGNRPFVGLIDELCVWNRSLDIKQLEAVRQWIFKSKNNL